MAIKRPPPNPSNASTKPRVVSRRRKPVDPLLEWRAPTPAAGGMLLLGLIVGAGMWRDWVWLLDTFTLALHEAGHPIVGFFSANLMVYGGTLFQLLFPWLTKRHFEKKLHPAGVVFALYWMAASIHNVGIYMADARAKALPLVGGLDPDDSHDWAEILWRWGLLKYDTAMGKMFMLGAWVLLAWAMWRCYKEVRGEDRSMPEASMAQVNKEEALVEQFKHLRGRTDSNMTHVEKPAQTPLKAAVKPKDALRPTQEEQG